MGERKPLFKIFFLWRARAYENDFLFLRRKLDALEGVEEPLCLEPLIADVEGDRLLGPGRL